jgi:xylulokinase
MAGVTADLLLGLDLGTTRCKTQLVDGAGNEVAAAVAPTPFAAGDEGITMPVAALLETAAGVVGLLGERTGQTARIAAVGIAGMAECGAPLDAGGRPLAPVIAWHDPRGTGVAERLQERFGDTIALRTGQRPRPVSTVAKLGWLVGHGLGAFEHWLGVPELCLHDLTGAAATEHSFASRTGCYDVVDRCWLDEVARAAGFGSEVFAPVLPAGSPMGRVTAAAAARWHLPAGVPVTLAGHDHLAGAAGAGATFGDLVNSVGTAESVDGSSPVVPDLRLALERRVAVSVAPGGTSWALLTGAARAGVILETAAGLLGRPLVELDALAGAERATGAARDAGGAGVLDQLQAPGAARDAGAAGLLDQLQAAGQDPSAPAPALPAVPPGVLWLGLLSALAARTASAARRVADIVPARRMLVIGGGSVSQPWLAEKAAAVPLPLVRPRTEHAAARGAALFAGVAAGWWPDASSAPRPAADPVTPERG